MNILFLSLSRFDDVNDRGIYSDLMREFVRHENDVFIASPTERRFGKSTYLSVSSHCQILKIKTLNIQKTNIFEKGIGTLLLETQFDRAIRKYWGKVRFDLILYSTPPITFNRVIERVKERCGCKSYLLLKDIFPQNAVDLGMFSRYGLLYHFFRKKEKKLYQVSDQIGCMSPANAAYVLSHNPEIDPKKIHINPNSIELRTEQVIDKQATKKKYGLPTDRPVFIYGGNLGKPQGIDFLLQILNYYRDDDRMYFLIVGSGTEYFKVAAWFSENNPSNARLYSFLPKQEYDRLVSSCDVGMIFLDKRFTIPNYPSRLLSYLENRMPVIVASDANTDIGRIAEENGYGFWSVSGEIKAFDCNVKKVLNSKTVAEMGEKGRRFLEENYTVNKSYSIIIKSMS